MSTVRATWHSVTLAVDDTDPFADDTPIEEAVHVPTVGLPIDPNATKESLDARLAETLRYESKLADEGASCNIKWDSNSTCFACPLFLDDDSPQGRLCRLGREQDSLLTLLTLRKHQDGR